MIAEFAFVLAKHDDPADIAMMIGICAVIAMVRVIALAVIHFRKQGESERAKEQAMGIPQGEVRIVFHTYTGMIFFTTQQRHDIVLPFDDAEKYLHELVRPNMTKGLWSSLAVLIPFITWSEYNQQMKKVRLARGNAARSGR
jgi:hypothetical protein